MIRYAQAVDVLAFAEVVFDAAPSVSPDQGPPTRPTRVRTTIVVPGVLWNATVRGAAIVASTVVISNGLHLHTGHLTYIDESFERSNTWRVAGRDREAVGA